MKLTLKQVADSFEPLRRVSTEKMPINVAWEIQRNTRLINPEFVAWDEKRAGLIKTKYGEEDKDGNFLVPPKNMIAFQAEMNILNEIEIELDIHVIPISSFTANISPADLSELEWMFDKK
jgi:hypothetical protein